MSKIPDARSPRDRVPLPPPDPAPGNPGNPRPTLPQARHQGDRRPLQPRHGAPQGTAYTRLPAQRHGERELAEIRRREAMRLRTPLAHIRSQIAPRPLVILGYLLAAAGAVAPLSRGSDWPFAPALVWGGLASGACALLVTLSIAVKKPRSRHHAAFIGIVALLVLVLAILQLLPQPNAT